MSGPGITVLPASDYNKALKELIPKGQKQSLWDQFLTGVEETYQPLYTQAQTRSAYDISDAYANYKKQQLQLQMNNQLGEGFKQRLNEQLMGDYQSAYADAKATEAENLYEIETSEKSTIQQGATDFSKLSDSIRKFDQALLEYANYAGIEVPENAIKTTYDEQGVATTELTDYGRMWYYDIMNKPQTEETMSFDQWMLQTDIDSELDYDERVAAWETYRQSPEVFRQVVAGLPANFTEDKDVFDYEEIKKNYETEQAEKARANEVQTKIDNISTRITKQYGYGDSYGTPGQKGIDTDLSDIVNYYGYDANAMSFSTLYDEARSEYVTIVKIDDSALTDSQRTALKEALGYYADSLLSKGQWTFKASSKRTGNDKIKYQQLLKILTEKE